MKFLSDENVKFRLSKRLREQGHDVKLAPKGASDVEIASIAKQEDRILLTHDFDFANPFKFPPSEYPGIILFRVFPPTLENLSKALDNLLEQLDSPDKFSGKLITLELRIFWVEE
jgi:predicted nuclease of predicted toxin-antitoxin system